MNLNTTVRNSHCFNLPDPVFQTALERFTTNLITTVINILVAPNAIIANVLILVAIINCSHLRSPSNLLIASSAVWCFSRLNNPTRIYQLQALGKPASRSSMLCDGSLHCGFLHLFWSVLYDTNRNQLWAICGSSIPWHIHYIFLSKAYRGIRYRDMDGEYFT